MFSLVANSTMAKLNDGAVMKLAPASTHKREGLRVADKKAKSARTRKRSNFGAYPSDDAQFAMVVWVRHP
jgi:hypothetical protein